ncbi:autotransporter-associated beta strand repeat protein [Pirellula staleyi DSM 6068]|uniref:Autotransporter-associated beta strand repeat protein n=1 Tax=Pirellula staleyi (strain ATCC 27377 / DSM 6068 / ICPB 4128) TaxID=530564 RepID=D2QWE4_PIRSD|nr:PA14 domain-containing protein [Pirellula staleyi]ADB16019.1 autotransporter-associated beta strand repeat protein [Pirellula staleyi DSM 6068]
MSSGSLDRRSASLRAKNPRDRREKKSTLASKRRMFFETLERREVLATLTWVGDVDGNWNGGISGTNTNWDSNTLPQDGDVLVFPAAAANFTQFNDTLSTNRYALRFTGTGYSLGGNPLILDAQNFGGGTAIDDDLGGNTISTPLTLATSGTINVDAGTHNISGNVTLGFATLTVSGNGSTNITGNVLGGYQEGLLEASQSGNMSFAANNGTSIYAGYGGLTNGFRFGQMFANSVAPWAGTTTWVYNGQFYDADGVVAFAEQIDDRTYVVIDGVVRLDNSVWNVATSTGTLNLGMGPNGDGWHDIEVRFSNGGGGAGASGSTNGFTGWSSTYGFAWSESGNPAVNGNVADLQKLEETIDGTATRLRTPDGGIVKNGGGTLTLAGTGNNYVGLTRINAGVVSITSNNALGSGDGDTLVQAGGQLLVAAGLNLPASEALSINGRGNNLNGAIRLASGTSTIAGPITALGQAMITNAGSQLNLTSDITLRGGAELEIDGSGNTLVSGNVLGYEQEGLLEGLLAGAFDETSPNPGTVQRLGTPAGNATSRVGGNPGIYWLNDNVTWVYTGQFFDADGIVSFAESMDDNVRITIDGALYLRDTNAGTPTGTGRLNLGMGPNGDGWHNIEIRFGDGGGDGGAVPANNFGLTFGFGISDSGTSTVDGLLYTSPSETAGGGATSLRTIDGGLSKHGTGTLTLTGTGSSYSGPTRVTGGTLVATTSAALGTTTSDTYVSDGATLALQGNLTFGAGEDITLGNVAAAGNTGLVILSGSTSLPGAVKAAIVDRGTMGIHNDGTSLTIGSMDVGLSGLRVSGSGNTTVTGNVTGLGSSANVQGGLRGEYYALGAGGATTFLNPINVASTPINLQSYIPTVANYLTPTIDFGGGTETIPGNGSILDRGDSSGNFFGGIGVNVGNDMAAYWEGRIRITVAGHYQFTTRSDDGSKLFINGREVVNNNFAQGMTNRSGTIYLTPGDYDILIAAFDSGGNGGIQASWQLSAGSQSFARQIIPSSVLLNDIATPGTFVPGGLRGQYFNAASIAPAFPSSATTLLNSPGTVALPNQLVTLLPTTKFTRFVDFGIGTEITSGLGGTIERGGSNGNVYAGVGVNVGADNIGGRWVGKITVPENATYRFGTRSDDGSKLFINGTQVVDNNFSQGMTTRTGDIVLTAGVHDIEITYYEGNGGSGVQAFWQQLDGTNPFGRRVIDPAALSISLLGNNFLTKQGTGVLTLGGSSNFSGVTTVSQGTLRVNGSLVDGAAATDVTVASGARLEGTGTIAGAVAAAALSTVAPGNPTGTLSVGSAALSSTGIVELVISGNTAGSYDALSSSGAIALSGATLQLSGSYVPVPGDTLTLVSAAGGISGTFANYPTSGLVVINGAPMQLTYGANSVTLAYDQTPTVVGTNLDQDFRVQTSGGNLQVFIDNVLTINTPLSQLSSLEISGQGGDDDFVIDYTASGGIFALPITVHGNTQGVDGDDLEVLGGNPNTVTYNYVNATDGSISIDGTLITYTGLEPVLTDFDASPAIAIFNLPGTSDQAILEDNGLLGDGLIRLRSQNGTPTFEVTTFSVPTQQLTINMGADAGVLTVAPGSDLRSAVTINGDGASDIVRITGALGLGNAANTGNLTINAERTEISANISTDLGTNAGSIAINGDARIGESLVLDTDSLAGTDGSVSFTGNVRALKGYVFVGAGQNWTNARALALASTLDGMSGYLVNIRSAAENAYVRSIGGTSTVWIGANDVLVEGAWRWADGPDAGVQFWQGTGSGSGGVTVGGNYANWNGTGEPNNSPDEDAATMIANGTWNDLGVGSSNAYIIEYGSSLFAADLTISTGSSNVTFGAGVGDNNQPLNNVTISAASTSFGGNVATISDLTVNSTVSLATNVTVSGDDLQFASTIDSSGGARTLTANGRSSVIVGGNIGSGAVLTSVSMNAPLIVVDDVTTTGAQTFASTNSIITRATHTTSGGAVTFSGPLNVLSGTTINTAGGNVVFGGTVDTMSHYQIVASALTWSNARTAATSLSFLGTTGHLASIRSAVENSRINAIGSGTAWIGANDTAVEGAWRWADGPDNNVQFWSGAVGGSTVGGNYANWNTGEPNQSGDEDGAEFQFGTGGWNDLNITSTRNYIVEFNAASPQSLSVNAGAGTISAANVMGSIYRLSSVNFAGSNISLVGVDTTGTQTFTASGETTVARGNTTEGAAINFSGGVRLAGAVNINTTANGAVGAAVTFGGAVNQIASNHVNVNTGGPITWTAARAAALAAGGYLANITSPAENAAITATLGGGRAWIGASDLQTESTWRWMDGPEAGSIFWIGTAGGTAQNGFYTNWNSGEPNQSGDEDYAEIIGAGGWNDLTINNGAATRFILEYNPDLPLTITAGVGDVNFNGQVGNSRAPGSIVIASGDDVTFSQNTTAGSVSVTAANTIVSSALLSTTTTASLTSGGIINLGSTNIGSNFAVTAAGLISNSGNVVVVGALTKSGAGRFDLTGAGNSAGSTSVSTGELRVLGTLNSSVNVAAAATLSGTGSVVGALSGTGASLVAAGTGTSTTGTLATGNIVGSAGNVYSFEIGGLTPGDGGANTHDQLNTTGTINLGGATLNVSLLGGFTPNALTLQEIILITNDGTDAVVGTFAGLAEGAAVVVGGSTFYISYSADSAGPGAGNDVALYSQPIINGTAGADIVTVTAADGAGNITVTYSLNNGAVIGGYTTTTPPNAFTFYGGDSDDTLNVNLNAINVALPGGIYYDGEGQGSPVAAGGNPSFGDVLAIVGTGLQTATYTSDAVIARAGTITSDALAGTITFRGLEPVNMFNLASAVVNFGGAADTIDISAGFGATVATSAIPALVVSGNSGGVAFEQVHLSGNIAVEINTVTGGSDAADSVTITSGANAHANANITIDTGVGADTIEVDGPLMVGAGGAISLTSGGSISVNNTITAGLAVTLTALTGSISDGNGASVNVATGLLVAQAATGVANAIDLDTTITSLIVSTTGATNGNININETSGLAVSSATTVNGNITLTAASGDIAVTTITAVGDATLVATTGAITDANAGVLNVSASNLSATSASGIDLDTSIATLTASVTGTGAIDIDEASAITLTSITTNNGLVDITSATGTMTVTSINAAGAVNLAVTDTGAADDDIIVSGTLSSTSNVVLLAGDDATLSGTISATGTVSVTIDAASADVGGATLSFAGDIDAVSATFTGGAEIDTFNVRPDQDNGLASTPISIFGGDPTMPAGDLLVLDITGLGVPTLTLGAVNYSGVWSFGASAAGVAYSSIETVQTTPLTSVYNLVLDMRIAGFQNGAADAIEIFLSAPNVFEVEVNGLGKFSGQADTINSFTVIGSSDSESLTIRETAAGLPSFDGAAPLVDNSLASGGVSNGAHLNIAADAYYTASNLTDVTIHFDGGLGDNSLALELLTAADVGYFSDVLDGQGSGNVGVGPSGAPLTLVSFADLDTLILDGAGGNLVVDASSSTSTADIEISDDGAAADGVTEITADTGLVATTTFEGFLALDLIAGGGNEAIDLVNIDSTSSLTSIDIVAGSSLAATDNSAHTVRIHAIKSGVPVTVTGDIGVDTFQVFDSGNSASNIASTLSFNGVAGDDDSLIVVDSGSVSADSVVITRTTIEGLTIASGIDITFTSIDDLDVTTSGGADTIRVNMTEAANDLDTAVVTGAGDNDQFYVNAADFLARLTLNGGLGDDTFGGTPSSTAPGYLLSASELDGVDDMIRPSLTTPFFINGNDPSVLPGDVLNIDVSALGGGLAATSPVLVSSGQVLSSTHATVTFTTIEDLNLADDGEMTSATINDIYIRGTNGNDTIQFARANTTLEPSRTRVQIGSSYTYHNVPGKTLVYGRGGNDIINQSNLQIPAEFYGEAGDDFLTGSFNNDLLVGGLGNDRINASSGNNIVWGDDAPTSDELNPHELNIGGNDTLSALGGNDLFYAGGGNDSVSPGAGDDWIHGGYGNDQLSGSSGNDRIYGAQGNDTISGDVGDDFLSGGDGDDRLYGRDGNDVLIGGDGVDLVDGGNGNDLVLAAITTYQGTSDTATSNTYSSAVDAAMLALLVAWNSGGPVAPNLTHTDDLDRDTVYGGSGNDLFGTHTNADPLTSDIRGDFNNSQDTSL